MRDYKTRALALQNNNQQYENKYLVDIEEIYSEANQHIAKFVNDYVIYCERAREEGWLGSMLPKSSRGLLGYMRTGFMLQIVIINYYKTRIPIFQTEFVNFFRSDWFMQTTLQNACIKPIYKKEHFDLIKRYNI